MKKRKKEKKKYYIYIHIKTRVVVNVNVCKEIVSNTVDDDLSPFFARIRSGFANLDPKNRLFHEHRLLFPTIASKL